MDDVLKYLRVSSCPETLDRKAGFWARGGHAWTLSGYSFNPPPPHTHTYTHIFVSAVSDEDTKTRLFGKWAPQKEYLQSSSPETPQKNPHQKQQQKNNNNSRPLLVTSFY